MINIIGFIIIFYIILFRILRIKVFSGTLTQESYTILLYSMTLFFLLLLIFTVFKLIKNDYKPVFNNKLIKIIIYYCLLIYDSPKKVYEKYIFNKLNVSYIIEKPIYYLVKCFAKKYKGFFPIIFCSIPKILVAYLFIHSIVNDENLNLFYKYVFLLIIPLFYHIYIYMIKNLAEKNLRYFIGHLKIEKGTKNSNTLIINFADTTPDFPDAVNINLERNNDKLLNWFIYNFEVYRNIYGFISTLETYYKNYYLYDNLIIYTFYFLGWFILLLHQI